MLTALDADPEVLDAHEGKFVDMIRTHSWFDTIIAANIEGPDYAFSTGIWATAGLPEPVVFSMSRESGHDLLWELFKAGKEGWRAQTGRPIDDVLQGCMCAFRCRARKVP